MAEWKKVVVSGSSAALKEITNDPAVATTTHLTNTRLTGSFSGSFSGDGTGITGVTGEIDIDSLASGNSIVGTDLLVYSDAGTEKSLTYAILSGSIYAGVTGDISIGEGGASSIGNDKVTINMIQEAATGSILSTITGDVVVGTGGDASIQADKITLAMLKRATTGSILATISGDVAVGEGGDSTIQTDAVEGSMLNSNVVGEGLVQGTDNALSMSINGLTGAVIDVANDSIAFVDANDSNATRKESISDLAGLQAGKGLAASSGVFNLEVTADSGLAFTGAGAAGTLGLDLDGTTGNDTLQMGANGLSLKTTIPGDRTFSDDVTVNGNLSVAGTASFTNATNLAVADKYILLNSGSSSTGDGGIVIQQATNGTGDLFGFDSGTTRFGVTSSFNADTAADFQPDAFVSVAIDSGMISSQSPDDVAARYKKNGNIFVEEGSDNIYIYVENA